MKPGALIRIQGPRQMGKSSLLARIVQFSSQQKFKVLSLDFQSLDESFFSDLRSLLMRLCFSINEDLGLAEDLPDLLNETHLGIKSACTRYLEKYVLRQQKSP